MLCAWIGLTGEKLWPVEFLEKIHCSISSISKWYTPESDMRVKSYEHLNFSRKSVLQFWVSRYVMRLNRTCEWKVMTSWISRENPLFNFERLDMLCAWIGQGSEKVWPFEFLENIRWSISSVSIWYAPEYDMRVKSYEHWNFSRKSVVKFRVSRYVMRLNRTCEWKVMTIWISWEHPLLNFECLNMLCAWIGHVSEKVWPFEFLESFHCSISGVSIRYAPESDRRVKSYEHLNFSRKSVVKFRVSRYVMRLNRKFEWKFMTILISRELPLFNF